MRRALKGVTTEWNNLALVLGLSYSVISAIKSNNPTDVNQCVLEVIHAWLTKKGDDPSWTNLYTALRDPLVNRKDIASSIENQFMQPLNSC